MNNFSLLVFCLTFLILNSCVKREFDEPPVVDEAADLDVTHTIAELKALHNFGTIAEIEEDIIIRGIVVSDDTEGNFFKVIIIQDETAGIEIQVDRVALHNDYPVGREVYVKVKGLFMGDNNGIIQLGSPPDSNNPTRVTRIPDLLRTQYFFRGKKNQDASPRSATISNLTSERISTLIKLDNVQFISSDVGTTLADQVNQFTRNLTLEDCDGNTIIIRTSGFSTFAGFPAPGQNGSIVGIYSVFGTDRQIFIRDLNDIQFDDDRCGGGTGGDLISIAEARAFYQGSDTNIPDDLKIKGIVISDRTNESITFRNMVIQEPNGAGITVRFTANNAFALGDELEIDISGVEISKFQGLLQLNNVPNNRANKVGTGTIIPEVLTVADILASFDAIESTLVKIDNAVITKESGNTLSGSCNISDATGTMVLFTRNDANFSDANFPIGQVSLTGILTRGGTAETRQISIRNLNDIDGDNGGGGDLTQLNETFSSVVNNTDLSLPGWYNIAEIGSRVWRGQTFQSNGYAQATSFNSPDPTNVMWLITPEITVDQAKEMLFETAMNFWDHDAIDVFISTDFTGNNLTTANWQPIEARLATSSDPVNEFIPSGVIDLSAYTGKFHVAFRYTGNNTTQKTTYRIDNLVIRNKN